ncbi:MAG: DNA-processing protein DprA [Clostridia bacterium]|nr:DNA-processing protein DprA [Clostridia bacterium]
MEIIDYNSKYFPDNLKKITNPPKRIYAEGNLDLLNTYSISVIGSRACSVQGLETAKCFARELSKQGLTITSGMALRN